MVLPPLRARLKSGAPLLAPFSIIPSVEVVELVGLAGFDGIILDLEHGAHGSGALGPLLLAAMARDFRRHDRGGAPLNAPQRPWTCSRSPSTSSSTETKS